MGILDRAIRRGVNRAVGNAVGNAVDNAVQNAVAPTVNNAVNQAAQSINQAAGRQQVQQSAADSAQVNQAANTLGGMFGSLQGAATGFANEAAKNMKICPVCGQAAAKDVRFCPECGAQLPEQTVADGSVCPSCGKQNDVGTKFCADCGAKLPCAVQEEKTAQAKYDAVLSQWETLLPQYPKWSFGGKELCLEQEDGYVRFSAYFGNGCNASNEVGQYRQLLIANGFHQAGQYPDICHLYNRVNGVCYHVDTEHCFDGGQDNADIYFNIEEPNGGYDYVKPEPKKNSGFFDLFK